MLRHLMHRRSIEVSGQRPAIPDHGRLEIEQVESRADSLRVLVVTFILWEASFDAHRTHARGVFELCSN